MEDARPHKRLRKGTKSCVECRRRKIRCTYEQGNLETCDGCVSRDVPCVAQENAPEFNHKQESLRERVTQLEGIVNSLLDSVKRLEIHGGLEPSERAGLVPGGTNDSSPDSDVDIPGSVPAHLGTLFENEVLVSNNSTEARVVSSDPKVHEVKMDQIRHQLLEVLPTFEEVNYVVETSYDWWLIHNTLFSPLSISGKDALIAGYHDLRDPRSQPASIAMWLTCLALTVLQLHPNFDTFRLRVIRRPSDFVVRVAGLVEHLVMGNNSLMATLQGLECASMFLRLQLNLGRVRKGWINLRSAIAFAELLNLHSSPKALGDHLRRARGVEDTTDSSKESTLRSMAATWHTLCTVDRFLSMILNLPLATKSIVVQSFKHVEEGDVLPRRYLWKLSEIAGKILDRDQKDDEADAFADTFMIEQELHTLARNTPAGWWTMLSSGRDDPEAAGSIVVQSWHQYLSLRTHLPFMLKAKDDRRYQYNSAACLNASRDLLWRYSALRMRLSSGFFILRVFDFQAFTAAVVLLLNLHGCDKAAPGASTMETVNSDNLLMEGVMSEMRKASDEAAGTIARQALSALEQLRQGLQADSLSSTVMRLQVPFLGTILVRRGLQQDTQSQASASQSAGQASTLQTSYPLQGELPASNMFQFEEPVIFDSAFTSMLDSSRNAMLGDFDSLDADWNGQMSLFAETYGGEERYS